MVLLAGTQSGHQGGILSDEANAVDSALGRQLHVVEVLRCPHYRAPR